jgi:hypothetical protein
LFGPVLGFAFFSHRIQIRKSPNRRTGSKIVCVAVTLRER